MEDLLESLSTHELLVQLVRERESDLLTTETDWGLNSRGDESMYSYKVLDAEAVAYLIEEVLALAGTRFGD